VAGLDELRMDMKLQPGDIQLLHNHSIVHCRSGFTDYQVSCEMRKQHIHTHMHIRMHMHMHMHMHIQNIVYAIRLSPVTASSHMLTFKQLSLHVLLQTVCSCMYAELTWWSS